MQKPKLRKSLVLAIKKMDYSQLIWLQGVIEKQQAEQENKKLKKEGTNPARPELIGSPSIPAPIQLPDNSNTALSTLFDSFFCILFLLRFYLLSKSS